MGRLYGRVWWRRFSQYRECRANGNNGLLLLIIGLAAATRYRQQLPGHCLGLLRLLLLRLDICVAGAFWQFLLAIIFH